MSWGFTMDSRSSRLAGYPSHGEGIKVSDESIVLNFLNNRAAQAKDHTTLNPEELIEEAMSQAETLAPDFIQSIRRSANDRIASRRKTARAARRAIGTDWAATVKSFDELLATSEEIHQRSLAAMIRGFGKRDEAEKVIRSHGRWLAGKNLKVLMTLTIHARACRTATEIAPLVFAGFDDGAFARLRTLYEIGVIHRIIGTGPYEVCERYHCYSAVEYLDDLRDQRRYGAQVGWLPPSDEMIAEAEQDAQEVYSLYGPDIRRPYEWARPLFPNKPGRITFADLDKHATNNGLRALYLTGNHGIHAGAYVALSNVDTKKSYLNSTRPSGRIENFELLIRGAVTLLELVSIATCRQVAAEYQLLDEAFAQAVMEEAAEGVFRSLQADVQQREERMHCRDRGNGDRSSAEGTSSHPSSASKRPRQRDPNGDSAPSSAPTNHKPSTTGPPIGIGTDGRV
ncbi:hypothetical protein GA0070624_5585 [Micromonospora rhizosphaerae]|uniref:Uncharacterized protein n=1 Tax=Micromonospora rhizosphaerae TaxID=568872 RepID=A0A1C6T437_9ACTN|nr:DUF5677 domain-containing protein [Micromonospora rhizosphaerae]SCL36554.1 hypothetical protein GA0070624_5585 [Micromonospora rhizosphaerae]